MQSFNQLLRGRHPQEEGLYQWLIWYILLHPLSAPLRELKPKVIRNSILTDGNFDFRGFIEASTNIVVVFGTLALGLFNPFTWQLPLIIAFFLIGYLLGVALAWSDVTKYPNLFTVEVSVAIEMACAGYILGLVTATIVAII